VGWINARRRRPVAGYAALLLGLVFVGLLYGALTRTGGGAQAAPTSPSQDIAAGKTLFQATCSSCHGLDAQGTSQAPGLIGAGAAAVDFQMSTGRMPAKELGAENGRGPVLFTQQQIYEIADIEHGETARLILEGPMQRLADAALEAELIGRSLSREPATAIGASTRCPFPEWVR